MFCYSLDFNPAEYMLGKIETLLVLAAVGLNE